MTGQPAPPPDAGQEFSDDDVCTAIEAFDAEYRATHRGYPRFSRGGVREMYFRAGVAWRQARLAEAQDASAGSTGGDDAR